MMQISTAIISLLVPAHASVNVHNVVGNGLQEHRDQAAQMGLASTLDAHQRAHKQQTEKESNMNKWKNRGIDVHAQVQFRKNFQIDPVVLTVVGFDARGYPMCDPHREITNQSSLRTRDEAKADKKLEKKLEFKFGKLVQLNTADAKYFDATTVTNDDGSCRGRINGHTEFDTTLIAGPCWRNKIPLYNRQLVQGQKFCLIFECEATKLKLGDQDEIAVAMMWNKIFRIGDKVQYRDEEGVKVSYIRDLYSISDKCFGVMEGETSLYMARPRHIVMVYPKALTFDDLKNMGPLKRCGLALRDEMENNRFYKEAQAKYHNDMLTNIFKVGDCVVYEGHVVCTVLKPCEDGLVWIKNIDNGKEANVPASRLKKLE